METNATRKKAAVGFIFITLLIDVIGFGIVIPVFPKLIASFTGGSISDAASYGGWMMFAYAIMQFVCSPILGNLSDRFGRRPVLLISLLGFGLDYLFLAYAPSVFWLFVGRIIAGITGASFTTAAAYIADISTPEKRAQNFGMIGAAFGLGFIVGPVIGGLLGKDNPQLPFLVAAGFTLLNWLYGFLILPESLPQEKRRAFEWKRANPVGSLMHLKKYPMFTGLISTLALVIIASYAVQGTWSFFTIERFKWSEDMVGYSLGMVGLMAALVQGGLIRVVTPRIGSKNAVYVGLSLYTIGMFLFAFATEGWMLFVILVPYCLGGLTMPSIQSIISNQVPANEQGELQGAMTSLMSAGSIVGPLIMTNLFSYFSKTNALGVYFPGAPFLLGAILMAVSLLLAVRFLSRVPAMPVQANRPQSGAQEI